ncbi:hypothetical protein QBC35DRAFT_484455 [Podospora australis]|uniref:RING-type E3 ubiquitin transferase n=1 Tax=Podospora australis TaxID=1536484 RepID=A0AAN6X205_9PEZI|nr:hypothetical protein QBC35DRAFT_484455 [Podospora australis]
MTTPSSPVNNIDDIQSQVLQTTLAEISTSRQTEEPSQQDRNCCVICLDTVSEPCTALPCAHSNFDFLCLVSWLQHRASCPLCKTPVAKVRHTSQTSGGEAFYTVPVPDTTSTSTTNPDLSSQRGLGRHHNPRRLRRVPPPWRAPATEDQTLTRRRQIYQSNLYSLHVGCNPHSRYRPCPTPAQLASTPHLISRARVWIRRELQVFSFLSASSAVPGRSDTRANNAEFLLEYLVAILKTVDIQGSLGQASDMLADFLGKEHALLFLHELRNWLRSPAVGLAEWDREVQYPDPDPCRKRGRISIRDDEEEKRRRGREEMGGMSWADETGDHWRPGTSADHLQRKKRRRVVKERYGDWERGEREGGVGLLDT